MATTQTYEVITNSVIVRSKPSLFASSLGTLKKGDRIDVISISGTWAYFKYNNKDAYVATFYIQKVTTPPPIVTGSITIKYLDIDTKIEVVFPTTYTNLQLKSYTYNAPSINGYTISGDTSKTVTLTAANPNQTITFLYKQILGSVTIKYIDSDTTIEITTPTINNNLTLGSYTYTAKDIPNYFVVAPSVKSVILTQDSPNQTIIFLYKKAIGSVTIKYLDSDTNIELLPSETYNDLTFGTYSYSSKPVDKYSIIEPSTQSVTINKETPKQTIIFTYKKIIVYGSVSIKYINTDTKEDIIKSESYTNLTLGSYTYTAKPVSKYSLIGESTKTVTLTENIPDVTIVFEYKKIYGTITIKYVDKITQSDISPPVVYKNLDLTIFTYNAISISGYTISGESTKAVTLTETLYERTITFEYTKILGKVVIQYIHIATRKEIATTDLFTDLDLKEYSYKSKTIDGYTLVGETSKTVSLTDIQPAQTIIFEYRISDTINLDEPPYIATRYVTPTFDINDDVILNFYVTDWNQSDVVDENKNTQFIIDVKLNNVSNQYTKYIGENSINLGKLNVREYELILQATDDYGRKSHELYNEFRVIDEIQYNDTISKNTHIITDEELSSYNISKNNDVSNSHNTKIGIQKLIKDLSSSGVRKAILPTGTYRVDTEFSWSPGNQVQYVKDPISIPSNFILDLNKSIFKQDTTPYEQQKALMFSFDHAYDSHLINGILEGDYGDRDISPKPDGNPSAEQVGCGTIAGKSKYCSFENLTVRKFCGYTMITGLSPSGLHAITQNIPSWTLGDINNLGTLDPSIQGKYTSDFTDLSKFKNVNTIRTGKYLGYQFNPDGDSWIVKYHFYDSSKQYISTIIGHQYRDIRKPYNASYLKCTYIAKDVSTLSQIQVIYYYFPRNCEFKNIILEDTRTCALAPFQGNNLLIDNCTFTRCATNITPVAVDFEDGWHNMQDYCLQYCDILEPVGKGDLIIVGGLDLIFRNNTNWRVASRGCARGQVFTNNKLISTNLGLTTHLMSAFTIFKSNTIFGFIDNGLGTLSNITLVVDRCIFEKIGYQKYNDLIIIRDCIFNWRNKTIEFAAPVLGGKFLRCEFNDFSASNIHIKDVQLTGCFINNMNMFLQGKFILDGCTVSKCTLATYTIDINIDLSNKCIINDFIFNKTSWANCNIIFNSIASTFNNSVTKNIIGDSFATFGNTKTFVVTTNQNTYLNNTILATTKVISNPNINFTNAN